MKKRKLKFFVMPVIYGLMCATICLTFLVFQKNQKQKEVDNNTYVNSSIVSKSLPTISETEKTSSDVIIKRPFISEKVELYKKYYEKENNEDIEKSILYYNNTYVQNTGVLYRSNEKFDIVSILDGEVSNIKKDETLGNVIEIKHTNNIISTYYGLNEIRFKKGDKVNQGDVIGTSGKINMDAIENGLLIEITKDSKLVNPEKYYDKKLNEI